MIEGIRNVALLAHVDAGKTTLTEQMLFAAGAITSPGRVDKGTCRTDSLDVERERGISVRSDTVIFRWKDHRINLIDTPGHADFSAETSRALWALDGAVLIVSAVEGIQAQTRKIWARLKDQAIPTLVFINKIDRAGSKSREVLADLQREFGIPMLALNRPEGEGERRARIASLFSETVMADEVIEGIAEQDEDLLNRYLDGAPLAYDDWVIALAKALVMGRLCPVLFGASIHHIGVVELLDALVNFLPAPTGRSEDPLSALVFKLDHVAGAGRAAWVRVFSGCIRTRDLVAVSPSETEEKVSRIERPLPGRREDIPEVSAGEVAILYGLKSAGIGDVLGQDLSGKRSDAIETSLISVEVKALNEADYAGLAAALSTLSEEEPQLNLDWRRDERQFHLQVMGRVQIEILVQILESRFGIAVEFGPPQVLYRETLLREVVVEEEYTMPKPCWARVRYRLKPGEPESGVVFRNLSRQDDLSASYRQEIERCLPACLNQGPMGWPVTDLEIILEWAEEHVVHSRAGDFAIATAMALMRGLVDGGTGFLEPVLILTVEVPHELVARVTGDIIQMRGEVSENRIVGDFTRLHCLCPVATSLEYAIRLSSMSGGRARLSTSFAGYLPCAAELGTVRSHRGVNPLDRGKYILHARKAL